MKKPALFTDLSRRSESEELMDRFDSDRVRLENTLRQFGFLNRFLTRVRGILKRRVVRTMQKEPDLEYHLIDLGAGACETDAWLLGYCRRKKLNLRITACDHDSRAVGYARRHYGNVPGLEIQHRDIMDIDALAPFDFVFASHLLHHLSDRQIIRLFGYLNRFSPSVVVLNDIRRSQFVYLAYYILSLLLSQNSFARHDGLISIQKGFRIAELKELLKKSGPHASGYKILTLFPGRILLVREGGV